MGYKSTTAQLFTVPPNMCAFFTVLITAYYSDKLKNRGYFIIAGAIVGICGYIMLLVAKTNAVRYVGTFLVAIGVFQGSPMIMVFILFANLSDPTNAPTGMDIQQRGTPLRARCRSRHGDLDCELFGIHRHVHLPAARCAEVYFGTCGEFGRIGVYGDVGDCAGFVFELGEQEEG
jgi:hypothetical protein